MNPDRHARFRSLLVQRMDEPLADADVADLEAHLEACPACRAVARDYQADRERMRAIRPQDPPRDLWARTSAALDREVADEFGTPLGPGFGRTSSRQRLRVAIGSFLTLTLVLALAGGQLVPSPSPNLPTATPFEVPAQAVAFLSVADGGELTLYRASVDSFCPPPHLECSDGPDGEPVARLEMGFTARQMAMSEFGQVLVSGRDDLGAEVFAIVTLPATATAAPPDPASPDASGGAGDPSAAPASDEPIPDGTTTPTRDLLEATDPPTPEPSDGPDVLPSARPDPSAQPDGSALPEPVPSITPPPGGAAATADSQAILTDVIATGSSAAWSADGTTLAFSAMPADRSHGSDVYIWQPGDELARPLTDDHASLFASWSGSRIVVSRADPAAADASGVPSSTVVIDPASGETRLVDMDQAWLPIVDPSGRFVIYWRGRLASRAGVAVPDDGRLYLASWRQLDPFRRLSRPATAPSAAPDGAVEPAVDASPLPSADALTEPPADDSAGEPGIGASAPPSPGDAASPGTTEGIDPTTTDGASSSPTNDAPSDAAPSSAAEPTTKLGPTSSPEPFELDRQRAVSGRTRDWVVRWSSDGRAYAVWTAEPGSTVSGSLVVRSAPSADEPAGRQLVDRVRAGRAFGLGSERLAWVAPLADGEGELWVSVWGAGGPGSVRLRHLDSLEAVPAS